MPYSTASRPAPALPSLEGPPLPEQASRAAVEWLVRLQAADANDALRRDWAQWLAADPDHARAWRHIESFGAHLRGLDAPLARGTLVRGGERRGRRGALKALALAAFAGSGAWLARDGLVLQWQDLNADYRTGTGQRRALTLTDGTRVDLDTRSAIALRYDDGQRLIQLLHGRILVATAPDPARAGWPARPLLVDTARGRLRPLGTRFVAQHLDDADLVAVLEGAVEILPRDAPAATRIVRAGEQSHYSRLAAEAPLRSDQQADAQAGAWAAGMLVARDMRLDAFIAELARYRPGRLACAPQVAALRVSGVYPLADPDRVLDMLTRTHPVEVRGMTRYWTTVTPREG